MTTDIRSFDFLHSDYVVQRNGVVVPLCEEDEPVTREELILALHRNAENKIYRHIANILLLSAAVLILAVIFIISADPIELNDRSWFNRISSEKHNTIEQTQIKLSNN